MTQKPSLMSKDEFIAAFGSIFEHSPWVAENTFVAGQYGDSASDLHKAMTAQFRAGTSEQRMAVLTAHPDLAGKLAAAKRLTPESTEEQASAGLDALTDEERSTFQSLNAAYVEKFGFPFIIAVRDNDKASILAAFKRRIDGDANTEFEQACAQVERIAWHRLHAMLA